MNARQEVQAFLTGRGIAGVVQVHKQSIEITRFQGLDDRGRGGNRLRLVSLAFKKHAEGFQNVLLVVCYEYSCFRGVGNGHVYRFRIGDCGFRIEDFGFSQSEIRNRQSEIV